MLAYMIWNAQSTDWPLAFAGMHEQETWAKSAGQNEMGAPKPIRLNNIRRKEYQDTPGHPNIKPHNTLNGRFRAIISPSRMPAATALNLGLESTHGGMFHIAKMHYAHHIHALPAATCTPVKSKEGSAP